MLRLVTAISLVPLLTSAAFANCSQELEALKPAVVTAETGAATNQAGMPETNHQKEVLSGNKQAGDTKLADTSGEASGAVEATTPHQSEVTGNGTGADAKHPSQLMKDATEAANKGDEKACMEKLSELKKVIGG